MMLPTTPDSWVFRPTATSLAARLRGRTAVAAGGGYRVRQPAHGVAAPGPSWFLLDIHAGGHGQLLEAPFSFARVSGGQGGAAAPAAPAAAPAPNALEPAVPAHRLPQRRRGRSPAAAWACFGWWAGARASWGPPQQRARPPWAQQAWQGNCGKISSTWHLGGLLVIRNFRFSSSGPSFVWVAEEGEGDAGSSAVHLVAIYVGQFEIQRSEGDRAAQLHQVPVVRLVLHDVAHALVDDHLADYVGAQRPQDVRRVAQLLDRRKPR